MRGAIGKVDMEMGDLDVGEKFGEIGSIPRSQVRL